MTRKLATIRRINDIQPIEDADSIDVATVGGWQVVVKKGEFEIGDLAVYLEIESWIPTELAPFLSKGQEPREYNGIKGERLRTVKLRGTTSQGLLLSRYAVLDKIGEIVMGQDVTELLGIQKWEAPIPAQLAGEVEGPFPTQIPKTDQERVQNLTEEFKEWRDNSKFTWEGTEKLDGSSMTVFVIGDREGICSRNWSLRETEGNSLWRVARREGLINKIKATGRNLALQGEIIGEGIQGNPYKIKGQNFYLFDIYDIDRGEYLDPDQRQALALAHGIQHVPVVATEMVLSGSVLDLLTQAEGKSVLNMKTEREGIVFKCREQPGLSFKAISNRFLIKNGN
jgi:RNA ligase (TIGR02306 family)